MSLDHDNDHCDHVVTWANAYWDYPEWTRRIADLLGLFPGNLFIEPNAALVANAINQLSERDRVFVEGMFGQSNFMPKRQKDMAADLGISQGRAHQIQDRAFARLAVILANTLKPIDLSEADRFFSWRAALDRAIAEYERPKPSCPHCGKVLRYV